MCKGFPNKKISTWSCRVETAVYLINNGKMISGIFSIESDGAAVFGEEYR